MRLKLLDAQHVNEILFSQLTFANQLSGDQLPNTIEYNTYRNLTQKICFDIAKWNEGISNVKKLLK